VWVRSTPPDVRPTNLIVSWRYNGDFIDTWEIQRAVTNKIFGSKIFSMDSADAQGLNYAGVAVVTRESSQAEGLSADVKLDPKLVPGNRLYIDQNVDLVNSYFYRVRARDINGNCSDWTYAGVNLTDSPTDRKLMSALSDDERVSLANDPRPITNWKT